MCFGLHVRKSELILFPWDENFESADRLHNTIFYSYEPAT